MQGKAYTENSLICSHFCSLSSPFFRDTIYCTVGTVSLKGLVYGCVALYISDTSLKRQQCKIINLGFLDYIGVEHGWSFDEIRPDLGPREGSDDPFYRHK